MHVHSILHIPFFFLKQHPTQIVQMNIYEAGATYRVDEQCR